MIVNESVVFARLKNSQCPSLESGNFPLLIGQARAKEPAEGAIAVCTLQPRRRCKRCLFVAIAVGSRESPHPQRRIDLGDDRPPLGNLPTIERPEVDGVFAVFLQIEEPRKTGVR